MEFEDDRVGRGIFAQEASAVVTGTVELADAYGDLRFLAGAVRGTRLYLSTFDGQHAVLLEGEVQPDGTMQGNLLTEQSRDPFIARRAGDVDVPDPLHRVRLKAGKRRLELEPLRGPRYAGKAVIVDIFGTWCPTCSDHAPLLVDLYREHGPRGLEILGLACEYTDSREQAARRVREFKEKHGIEWEVLIADSTLEELASEGLAGLSAIEGVPVTVFVKPDGTVHAVYTGFSGPATGAAHREAKAEFRRLTAEILGLRRPS
jgi:thiol-disulfide isomerase/thioredoxin